MKSYLVLLLFSLFLLSCKKDSSFAAFEGAWEGVYTGDDTGEWHVTIDDEGMVEGTAVSDSLSNFPFNLTGQITESGQISAHATVVIGDIEFVGQLDNGAASGTWTNLGAGLAGGWNGTKK